MVIRIFSSSTRILFIRRILTNTVPGNVQAVCQLCIGIWLTIGNPYLLATWTMPWTSSVLAGKTTARAYAGRDAKTHGWLRHHQLNYIPLNHGSVLGDPLLPDDTLQGMVSLTG